MKIQNKLFMYSNFIQNTQTPTPSGVSKWKQVLCTIKSVSTNYVFQSELITSS